MPERSRSVCIRSVDFAGIAVWVASQPVYDSRPESIRANSATGGFHVHAYKPDGTKAIDGTFDEVVIDDVRVEASP